MFILEEYEREKIINALTKELKHNPNKETKDLLEKLKNTKQLMPVIVLNREINFDYVRAVTDIFIDSKMLNINEAGEVNKKELNNVKDFFRKIIELEDLKRNFYDSSKEDYDDYERYKKRLDKFTKDVGEIYLSIYKLVESK